MSENLNEWRPNDEDELAAQGRAAHRMIADMVDAWPDQIATARAPLSAFARFHPRGTELAPRLAAALDEAAQAHAGIDRRTVLIAYAAPLALVVPQLDDALATIAAALPVFERAATVAGAVEADANGDGIAAGVAMVLSAQLLNAKSLQALLRVDRDRALDS